MMHTGSATCLVLIKACNVQIITILLYCTYVHVHIMLHFWETFRGCHNTCTCFSACTACVHVFACSYSPPPPSLQSSRGVCRNKARIVAYHLNRLLIRSKVKFGIVSVFGYILSCICIFVSLLHLCCVVLCRCRCSKSPSISCNR